MNDNRKVLFEKAIEIVKTIGATLTNEKAEFEITAKGKTDFVTQMDVYVQEELQRHLSRIAPEYQLLAEEKDNQSVNLNEKLWILDPIDGTTNLIHHFNHSGISLAMADEGKVFAGIVYLPYTDEIFTAYEGKGAFCNGKRIQVSKCNRVEESLLSVGTNPGNREKADSAFMMMRALYDKCHDIRRIGAASVELCYVAAGRLDGYLEHSLKVWDYAAGAFIVQEAGGLCTDYEGNMLCLETADVIASNQSIHQKILECACLDVRQNGS